MTAKLRLGSWITVPHPTIVDLMTDIIELEWLCIDMEHSPTARIDLQMAVALIQGRGKRAFVRVKDNHHSDIKYCLDSGVDGIIIPMVNSAAHASEAVANCFYPPKGRRGVGLARAQRYGFGFAEHLKKNLSSLELIVQIEHIDAVRDIDQILAIEEIAGVFVGPYDLSGSMGIPGQFDDPRMIKAIAEVAAKTKISGKLLGAHVIPPDHGRLMEFINSGYNFIAFSIDTFFLGQKLRDEVSNFVKVYGLGLSHQGDLDEQDALCDPRPNG